MRALEDISTRELLQEFRKELGRGSMWAFHRIYMENTDDPEYADGGDHLWNMCSWLDQALVPGWWLIGAFPRDHMKTTLGTTTTATRVCCYRIKKNIGILGATAVEATNKMRNVIDSSLEGNALIVEDFGADVAPAPDSKGRPITYNDKEVILTNGVRMAAFPFGKGKIRGQNVGGNRMDLLIIDDPEDDESVQNPDLREKDYRWFQTACVNSMSLMSGNVVWLGTVLHNDSLLSRLIKTAPGKKDKVLKVKLPAWNPLENFKLLWPERWTLELLTAKKNQVGHAVFSQEYLNTPLAEEDQAYKPEYWKWFNRASITEESGRYCITNPLDSTEKLVLNTIMAVDPAISQTKDADYFAYSVWGYSPGHPFKFQLEVYRGKISFPEQLRLIKNAAHRWRVMLCIIEAQAYQAALEHEAWRMGVPTKPVKHHTGKLARNKAAAIHCEKGEVYLPRHEDATKLFVEEAESFPVGVHDDMLDTYSMSVEEIVHGSGRGGVQSAKRKRQSFRIAGGFVEMDNRGVSGGF